MSIFDQFFYSCFNHYKPKHKQKANSIALFYISSLQCALLFFAGVAIGFFLKQMHSSTMASDKAWLLFVMGSSIIIFKNWIQYSGKKRKVMNAKNLKNNVQPYPIWVLWILLFGSIALSIIVFQRL